MNTRVRVILYVLMILLIALVSAFSVISARADDDAPPPPAPPSADTAPAQASAVVSSSNDAAPAAPASDVAPTDAAPTDVAPTDAAPATGTAADLAQVPAGTDVVVVNADGDSVPLVSQEAADIISNGDPIWCPATVATPVNNGSGCSTSFGSFKEVVDYLTNPLNAKTVAGTIWISKLYNSDVDDPLSTGNFTLDGSLLPASTSNFALTIKGGWNGLGTGTVTTTDPSVFNGDSLSIINWNADVTLSDIEITGVTSGTALDIETSKNITLTRVNVHDNTGDGAYLNNRSGVKSGATDKVTISSSQFNANLGADGGLGVYSWGAITISNLTAGSNAGLGANLDNCSWNIVTSKCDATTVQPVAITGSNTFSENSGDGLYIDSLGNISTNNLTASQNQGFGAWFENDSANATGVNSTGTIVLSGNNAFNENDDGGLYAYSFGAITLNNVNADQNGGNGALLENDHSTMVVAISVNNTATYSPSFSNNGDTGLVVYSRGAITLMDLDAEYNGQNNIVAADNDDPINDSVGYGVYLDNGLGTGIVTIGTARANWCNSMSGNFQSGLEVYSKGAVTLNNPCNDGNGGHTGAVTGFDDKFDRGYGALIDNSNGSFTPVTVTGTWNQFDYNFDAGLSITSKGAITLKDIDANDNNADGAYLDNTQGTLGVTLTGLNAFSENFYTGLEVYTNGAISASNLVADSNTGSGAWFDNCQAYNDTVNYLCTTTTVMSVTLTGTSEFKSNKNAGLHILTNGAVTTNNVTASDNQTQQGVWIDNEKSSAGSLVTLNGTNTFNDNADSGIYVNSRGIITLNNVTADGNGWGNSYGYGTELYNDNGTLPKAVYVYVTGSNRDNNFFNNYSGGLRVYSYGAITLSGVDVQNNNGEDGDGAYLDNCMWDGSKCLGSGDVTINGWGGVFNNNGGNGLEVYSKGAITATSLNAWSNIYSGAWLDNTHGTGLINLGSMGGTNYGNNGGDGLDLFSHGAVTLNNTGASNNGQNNYSNEKNGDSIDTTFGDWGAGIYLDNSYASGPQVVNLTGNNNFYSNFDSGLYIYSKGSITANNLTANGSHQAEGILLDNTFSGHLAPQNVTLTGYVRINDNYYDGLVVYTYGAVTVTNIDANRNGQNGGSGVYIDNYGRVPFTYGDGHATLPKAVILNGNNNFQNTNNSGLEIFSLGAITVNNLWSHNNGMGAWLDNTLGGPGVQQNVSITGFGDVGDNWNTGLTVYSYGAITLANVQANSNGQNGHSGDGVYLDNSENSNKTFPATVVKAVTITGYSSTDQSHDYGLHIESLGAITIANLEASNHNGNGVLLNNDHANATGGVTITGGASTTDSNGYGLQIFSRGLISLNVNGTWIGNNGSYGWSFDNHNSPTKAGVTLTVLATNSINFSHNGTFGLSVQSAGPITVNNLGADSNGAAGIILDNRASSSASPQNVTVNGYGNFNNNGDDGLDVFSYGAITLTNTDAENNGQNNFNSGTPDPLTGWGVYLDNCGFVWDMGTVSNSDCTSKGAAKGITLNGANTFNNNFQDGLWATSYGPISARQMNAQGNGGDGAYLDNQWDRGVGGITITSATANDSNDFSNDGYGYINGWTEGDGLAAYSNNGAITINNLEADNNGATGAWLNNTTSSGFPTTPQGVTVSGYGNFNNNGNDGLDVYSYGAIALANINAGNNGQNNFNSGTPDPAYGWGAYLDNCAFDWDTVGCTSKATPKGITLTGTNNFNNNFQDGLWATSLGPISSTNLTATNNGGDGAYLDNQWAKGVGGISLTALTAGDWNLFWDNGYGFSNGHTAGTGLSVFSNGTITLNNIWARDNYSTGAIVDNGDHFGSYAAAIPQTVTITGRNWFENNGEGGLEVVADGNISINNLLAYQNQDADGAWLDNCLYNGLVCQGHGGITLTGINSFNNNYNGDGLHVDSHGNIILNNVTADNNDQYGVWGGADGTILVSCGSMNNNTSNGWWFQSWLTVTLKGVTAYGNNGGGTWNTHLDNGTLVTSRSCP